MTEKDDKTSSGGPSAASEDLHTAKAKPRGGDNGGTKRHPQSNMEIAVIARKKVRGMLMVLDKGAKNEQWPASARVSAAKAIIQFAQLKSEDVKDLTDEEVAVLARKIVAERNGGKDLLKVVDGGKAGKPPKAGSKAGSKK